MPKATHSIQGRCSPFSRCGYRKRIRKSEEYLTSFLLKTHYPWNYYFLSLSVVYVYIWCENVLHRYYMLWKCCVLQFNVQVKVMELLRLGRWCLSMCCLGNWRVFFDHLFVSIYTSGIAACSVCHHFCQRQWRDDFFLLKVFFILLSRLIEILSWGDLTYRIPTVNG